MAGTKRKRRRKIIYRRKSQNRASMLLALTVMLVILIAVAVSGVGLTQKLREYDQKKSELQDEIASEQQRSQQIEQYSKYTQTDEYVEEVARDKLGLVKKGETVFRKDGKGSTSSSAAESSSEGEIEQAADSQSAQNAQSSDGTASQNAQTTDGAASQNAQSSDGKAAQVQNTQETIEPAAAGNP